MVTCELIGQACVRQCHVAGRYKLKHGRMISLIRGVLMLLQSSREELIKDIDELKKKITGSE